MHLISSEKSKEIFAKIKFLHDVEFNVLLGMLYPGNI